MKDCQQVWESCLRVIKTEIPEQSFRTWFVPLRPLKLNESVLTIQVPSLFYYEWLEEHYIHVLKRAIHRELGNLGKLEYSVMLDKGTQNTQPILVNFPNKKEKPILNGSEISKVLEGKKEEIPVAPKNNPEKKKSGNSLTEEVISNLETPLNPAYRFENFIEGECNRLARSAGLAIVKKPGQNAFNPFVIHSQVGLGKTHLAQAIAHEIRQTSPNKKVLYVTSENFTMQFVEAIATQQIQRFMNYYMKVDVLIIDDIQFLSGKEKTQENFFHIFNHLHQTGKQIILTSDCPPKDLQGLQERLISRFKWGLVADLQAPDLDTRLAIIQHKLYSEGAEVKEEVISYLAQNVNANVREIEGVLIRLMATSSLTHKTIDIPLVHKTLNNVINQIEKTVSVDSIIHLVSEKMKVSVEEIKSRCRVKNIAKARQIAMFLAQQYIELPLKKIGEQFGGKDHSTIVHARKAVEKNLLQDKILADTIAELKSQIGAKPKKA